MRNIIDGLLIVSAQASIMVMAVLILRLFIKKTYKVFTYLMWLAALLRLCVPIQIESPFGIIEAKEKSVVELSVDNSVYDSDWQDDIEIQNTTVTESDETVEAKSALTKEQIVVIVWLTGAILVATLAAVQVVSLRRRVRFAIHVEDNIWETDNISTAFVIGVFRPRIYIPASLNKKERDHILMHEKMHIRHGDNIVRVAMLLVNVFYWWNPLVWVATHLMKKDMEMFCDESVIKKMDNATQGAYLKTLLNCSAKNSGIIPVMSFGETNTEVRIRHIMNLKRPKLYIFVALIVFGIIGAVGCVRVARTGNKVEISNQQKLEVDEENIYIYVNEDRTKLIYITSEDVSFGEERFCDDSSKMEYYMNCVLTDCGSYEYQISDSKIQLLDDSGEKVLSELEIINGETLEYQGEEYSFIEKVVKLGE